MFPVGEWTNSDTCTPQNTTQPSKGTMLIHATTCVIPKDITPSVKKATIQGHKIYDCFISHSWNNKIVKGENWLVVARFRELGKWGLWLKMVEQGRSLW